MRPAVGRSAAARSLLLVLAVLGTAAASRAPWYARPGGLPGLIKRLGGRSAPPARPAAPRAGGDEGGALRPAAAARLPPLPEAKAAFLKAHPEYGYGGWTDEHWEAEVGVRLPGQHYLDHTGAAQYADSQLAAATALLAESAWGNPHSRNPSSLRAARAEEAARRRVLAWLGAGDDEYDLVWTRGATESLKMVGEYFPWSASPDWTCPTSTPPGGVTDDVVGTVSSCGKPLRIDDDDDAEGGGGARSHFVYTRANHKSVLGVGAYAKDRGAALHCVDEPAMAAWLAEPPPPRGAPARPAGGVGEEAPARFSLVAYPAKDNYAGVLFPLEWVRQVHAKSTPAHRWLVLLDAAAFAPTHRLDLSVVPADFVALSFYKVMGFPTGLGALVVRRSSAALLHKVYFGGGAVDDATAQDVWRVLSPFPAALQDGTIHFQGIAQLQFGFDLIDTLGGMDAVHRHVRALQAWTYGALSRLVHRGGQPLLTIFGAHATPERQSATFEFLVHSPNGSVVPFLAVEAAAADAGLHLRTGCHCNPGACYGAIGIKPAEERAATLSHNVSALGFITVLRATGPGGALAPVELPTGSVRASLGALSTFEDVYALADFLGRTYLDRPDRETLTDAAARAHAAARRDAGGRAFWNAACGA
ncbi:hypothetical protein HT031_006018 [Scenedesmus sp. PABB004]|nr:hypothetical protein HT031_006018 [Scenedesmus sp. PABB004]